MQIDGKEVCKVRKKVLRIDGKEYIQKYITIPKKTPLNIGDKVIIKSIKSITVEEE